MQHAAEGHRSSVSPQGPCNVVDLYCLFLLFTLNYLYSNNSVSYLEAHGSEPSLTTE